MAETKEYLLAEMEKRLARCKEITDTADKAARDLTEDETAELKSQMGRIEEYKIEVKRIEDREVLNAQLESLGTVAHIASAESVEVRAKSIGEAFVQSADYKRLMGLASVNGMPQFDMPAIELKAAGDATLESDSTNADAIAPSWFGLETPGLVQWPTLVQDVMNVVQLTTGNTANYPIAKTRTIESQAATAEGSAKKGATFEFDYETATLLKWTAFGGASEEMFQDAPTLVNYINTELGRMALQSEEAAVVAALYTATTQTADGTELAATPTPYDMVREGMATIELVGGSPNVLLINPMDSAYFDVQRAVAGTGDYFSGGPYASAASGLWGQIRQVKTPAIAAGTALLGDFSRGARLFRKGGLRVDSSNSHGTYFEENKIAIRGEIRSITGVTYPEFFCEIVLGTSS